MIVVLRSRPRAYAANPQQVVFKAAVEHCGIKAGISKSELMDRMRNCIPQFYRDLKALAGGENAGR
jgi:hypothetical protein